MVVVGVRGRVGVTVRARVSLPLRKVAPLRESRRRVVGSIAMSAVGHSFTWLGLGVSVRGRGVGVEG